MESDGEWGIGQEAEGHNLMGEILMETREYIKDSRNNKKKNERIPNAPMTNTTQQTGTTEVYTDSMLTDVSKFLKEAGMTGPINMHSYPGKTAAVICRIVCADLDTIGQRNPKNLIVHAGTNDLETSEPADIVEIYKDLITNIKFKLPQT